MKNPNLSRRNFALLFADYVFFGTAFGIIGANTVIPDFMRRLTDSEAVIGLVSSLYYFCWLIPQLGAAQMLNRLPSRKPFLNLAVPFRMLMVLVALAVASASPSNSGLILVVFVTGYLLFALGDGLVTIAWADTLGLVLTPRQRSLLFNIAQFVVAVSALGVREVVLRVLAPGAFSFPQNFAILFGIAAVLFIMGGICLALLIEPPKTEKDDPGPTLRQLAPFLGNVLRNDGEFRKFTIARTLLDLTAISAPFYIGLGAIALSRNVAAAPDLIKAELVANSALLSTVGSAIGAVVMGWVSHRSGSRAVLLVIALASCLHPIAGLLFETVGQPAVYTAFFLLGFVTAGIAPGYFDWIITHAPPERRPIYIGLTNTISAVSHLAPALGGLVLAITNSYPILFGLGLIIALGGVGAVLTLSEPRHRLQARLKAEAELERVAGD